MKIEIKNKIKKLQFYTSEYDILVSCHILRYRYEIL